MAKEHFGLKVLGIISILCGIFLAVGGLYYISIGGVLEDVGEESIIGIIAIIPVGITLIAMGAVMIVVGLILAYLGYHLYKHKRWAYWLYFILAILGLIMSLVSFSIIGIAIGAIIIWYLWSIRGDFKRSGEYTITWRN